MGIVVNILNSILIDPTKSAISFIVCCFVYVLSRKYLNNDKKPVKCLTSEGNGNESKSQDMNPTRNGEEIEDDDDCFDRTRLIEPLFPEDNPFITYVHERLSADESLQKSLTFYNQMDKRRSVRFISSDPVSKDVINNLIKTAGTSPSGAHTEPWTFVAIKNTEIKSNLRDIVEAEERINYGKRMGDQWVSDLGFVKTNYIKEYITEAPWIILVFRQAYYPLKNGKRRVHYYNEISTSVSVGLLIAAIHNAGLVTVTTTPLNCGPNIRTLLSRPSHEKLMFLLPVGYPKHDAEVPDIKRKNLDDIMIVM